MIVLIYLFYLYKYFQENKEDLYHIGIQLNFTKIYFFSV